VEAYLLESASLDPTDWRTLTTTALAALATAEVAQYLPNAARGYDGYLRLTTAEKFTAHRSPLFCLIFLLCLLNGLPLHIARAIGTASL